MEANKRFYLNPVDSRKSFYNKCYVEVEHDGSLSLYSYNTLVARFVNGRIVRKWQDYSTTTMRHINAFVAYCGVDGGGKKWWDSLEVE